MKKKIQYKSANNNSLQTNSVLFFVLVIFIIFAVIASIVAIVLEVKHKKNTDKETSKTTQPPSLNLGLGGQNDMEILTGSIFVFGGTSVPDGYLLCDGKDYSSIYYPDLYNVIGTTFGTGDESESTDFNVPDLIDKYIKGGNIAVNTVEGQNSFTVKPENIVAHNPTIPSGYNNIPVVFNSPNGIDDWDWKQLQIGIAPDPTSLFEATKNTNSNGSNLTNALQIGNSNPVTIDNRPASITIMYIIKT
jgi:microcystin-dependent protein